MIGLSRHVAMCSSMFAVLATLATAGCAPAATRPVEPALGPLPPATIEGACPSKLADVVENQGTTRLDGRTVEEICFLGATAALEAELRNVLLVAEVVPRSREGAPPPRVGERPRSRIAA